MQQSVTPYLQEIIDVMMEMTLVKELTDKEPTEIIVSPGGGGTRLYSQHLAYNKSNPTSLEGSIKTRSIHSEQYVFTRTQLSYINRF